MHCFVCIDRYTNVIKLFTSAFLMRFHPDWCVRDETGMIGTLSGMKTPENGMVGDSRRGAVVIVLKCSA